MRVRIDIPDIASQVYHVIIDDEPERTIVYPLVRALALPTLLEIVAAAREPVQS